MQAENGELELGVQTSRAPEGESIICGAERHGNCRYTRTNSDAVHSSISVERNPRTSPHAMAQPISALASGDLLRGKDATNRLSRLLGVHVAGAQQSLAIPEMDGWDGTLCPPQAQAKELI